MNIGIAGDGYEEELVLGGIDGSDDIDVGERFFGHGARASINALEVDKEGFSGNIGSLGGFVGKIGFNELFSFGKFGGGKDATGGNDERKDDGGDARFLLTLTRKSEIKSEAGEGDDEKAEGQVEFGR